MQATPLPSLPLIEPDVQISRIRLSCRPFIIGLELPVLADIDSGTWARSLLSDVASISTDAVYPAEDPSGSYRHPDSFGRLFRSRPLGQAAAYSLDCCVPTVGPLRSRRVRPFFATMGPSDSRRDAAVLGGSLRFRELSFPARHLQPPRRARRLLVNVSSPPATGFSILGSMATLIWCNEAESSSLVLRLTGSPLRASAWGLLLSPPHRLLAVHSSNKFISFHMNRQLRFILTHRITLMARIRMEMASRICHPTCPPLPWLRLEPVEGSPRSSAGWPLGWAEIVRLRSP